MADANARGPLVGDSEILFRAIAQPSWWNDGRLTSQIFTCAAKFSAFAESRLDGGSDRLPALSPKPDCGWIRFVSRDAKNEGFSPHFEEEDDEPAHVNVYCDLKSNQRKRAARRLLQKVSIEREPTF